MGQGEPDEGDPLGTWGGYYGWDAETIADSAAVWRATIYLISSGDYPVDIPDFDSSQAHISIRRPQQFDPPDSGSVTWELRCLSDSRVMQSGRERVGDEGLVTIPDVTVTRKNVNSRSGWSLYPLRHPENEG